MDNPRIQIVEVTQFVQNCMIVHPTGGGPAVLIDPGGDWDRISAQIEAARADIKAILVTHGHIDHVGALAEAAEATGAPVWLHTADDFLYASPPFGLPPIRLPDATIPLSDEDTVDVAGLSLRVVHTPGHSPGHVCFITQLGEGTVVFGGDLVFMGSIGRTDLPGGDIRSLVTSVRDKIWPLPDDTIIFPGHGPRTTVGQEKQTNPFVGTAVLEDLLT